MIVWPSQDKDLLFNDVGAVALFTFALPFSCIARLRQAWIAPRNKPELTHLCTKLKYLEFCEMLFSWTCLQMFEKNLFCKSKALTVQCGHENWLDYSSIPHLTWFTQKSTCIIQELLSIQQDGDVSVHSSPPGAVAEWPSQTWTAGLQCAETALFLFSTNQDLP